MPLVVQTVVENYQQILHIHMHDGRHVKKFNKEDAKAVVSLTSDTDPFTTTPDRVMKHYKCIRADASARIDKPHFMNRLAVTANRLKRGIPVDIHAQLHHIAMNAQHTSRHLYSVLLLKLCDVELMYWKL